jgi:hypothetical protein
MVDFDPYAIIDHVMNDTLNYLQQRCLKPSDCMEVNFVAVLAYGSRKCKVIPRSQFLLLHGNDVLGMYSQSILIPPVADWLCYELQEPFGEYKDVVALSLAYFALLDNHRKPYERVVEPSMVRSDLLRYSLFYYLLRVDTNMDRWATIRVREHCDERVIFVYDRTIHYYKHLIHYDGPIDMHVGEIAPTDSFLESFYPMISIVTSLILSDFKTSLDHD